nr:carbonic anhydrase [Chlorobium sp. KB01]
MKKLIVLMMFSVLFNIQKASASSVPENGRVSPSHVLRLLIDGNRHFAQRGSVKHLDAMVSVKRRLEVAKAQKPIAVVIACSDSRLSPEILFDMGLGEIFTVRVAGNVIGPHEAGSVEYAVEHLGVGLVMVLGHERCGAVTAAYDASVSHTKIEGNIGSITESIKPAIASVLANGASGSKSAMIEQCSLENIRMNTGLLESSSPVIKEKLAHGKLQLISAYYDLDNGMITIVR